MCGDIDGEKRALRGIPRGWGVCCRQYPIMGKLLPDRDPARLPRGLLVTAEGRAQPKVALVALDPALVRAEHDARAISRALIGAREAQGQCLARVD